MCVYMYVFVCMCVSMSVCVCMFLCMCVCVFIYVCFYVCVFVCVAGAVSVVYTVSIFNVEGLCHNLSHPQTAATPPHGNDATL